MNDYNVIYHVRNPQNKCKKCGRGFLKQPTSSGTRWCPVCGAEHDREANLVDDSPLAKTTRTFKKV